MVGAARGGEKVVWLWPVVDRGKGLVPTRKSCLSFMNVVGHSNLALNQINTHCSVKSFVESIKWIDITILMGL